MSFKPSASSYLIKLTCVLAFFTSCSKSADHHLSNETQSAGMQMITKQTVMLGFYYPSLDEPYRMSNISMTATIVNDQTLITGAGFIKPLIAEKHKFGLPGPLPVSIFIADRQTDSVRVIEQLDDVDKLFGASGKIRIHLPFDPYNYSYESLQFAALNLKQSTFSSILGRDISTIDIEPLNPLLKRNEKYHTSFYTKDPSPARILTTQSLNRANMNFGVTQTSEGAILFGKYANSELIANPRVAAGGPVFYIDPEFDKPVLIGINNQTQHLAVMQNMAFLENPDLKLRLRTDFWAAFCLARGVEK